MLKVFLVEDEFVVRQGIKNNIDWKTHGYEFCGEASDGEQALPMIQQLKPDIVITDIKMPFMDGLSLSKYIKKEFPWIEIIILSGYAEFEYAKEAIKLGVAEYISKPISGDELVKVVDSMACRIEEKQKERQIKEKYEKEMEENYFAEKRKLFQYLVTGKKNVTSLLEIADKLNIDLSAMFYNVVLMKLHTVENRHEDYVEDYREIEKLLNRFENSSNVIFFNRDLEGEALIIKAGSKEELELIQERCVKLIKEKLDLNDNSHYFIALGGAVTRLSEIPTSFEKASHAFAHRYLVKENCVLDSALLEKNNYNIDGDTFDIKNIDAKQMDRSKVTNFLRIGDRAETVYFVEEFINGLGTNAIDSNMFRQYIAMDTYFCVVDFVEKLQFGRDEIKTPDVTSMTVSTPEFTIKYIKEILEKAIELREQVASDRYGDIVEDVKRYIDENYADEDLSLNVLANHVNFSPNHLSMVFSQQTGMTFIKYLTDYRMNKAKELLKCTAMKSSAISLEVGYKDPHYFSFLFKKTQGITPTQYREKKDAD